MSFEDMQAHGPPFSNMLRPQEHIYLFSRTSVRALFERVGCPHVTFEPAMFAAYDMFVVASRTSLVPRQESEAIEVLTGTGTVESRLVLGLLDLDRERAALTAQLRRVEGDAAARLENTLTLEALLQEANADRAARLTQIHELGRLLQEANADRAARLEDVHTLGDLLKAENPDVAAHLAQIHEVEQLLAEANADRVAWLDQVHTLATEVERLLAEAGEDRAARLALHQRTVEQVGELQVSQRHLEQMLETTREALMAAHAELDELRTRILAPHAQRAAFSLRRSKTAPERPLVAIDVTPILPGSENGGAKAFVLALIDGLARRRRHRYMLLTSSGNHASFAAFEQPGMERLCLTETATGQTRMATTIVAWPTERQDRRTARVRGASSSSSAR